MVNRGTLQLDWKVTTEWLVEHMEESDLAIVDTRGKVNKKREIGSNFDATSYEGLHDDYANGHIPGAVFVDWTKDIAAPDENGVPAQLACRDQFVTAMEERGISQSKRVVVYDNGNMLFSTRFWWAMRHFGHDRVHVLDGGFAKWEAENRPVSSEECCPLKLYADWGLTEDQERPHIRVSKSQVLEQLRLADGGKPVQLVDARAADQFTGAVRRAQKGGHIPGAVNIPYKSFLQTQTVPGGKYKVFKEREAIEEIYRAAGVNVLATTVAYCNGGVASTVALFALQQLGNRDWSNYDGSWNEWGNDPSTPISTNSSNLKKHK